MPTNSKHLKNKSLLFLLLSMFAAMAIFPSADNPKWLRDSAGFHFDPYSKIHNARNLVLFGELNQSNDHWKPIIHSPVFTTLQSVIFKLFSPGLIQSRMLGIIATLFTLIFLMQLLRKEYSVQAALFGGMLLASSQVVLFSGRSGLIEPLLLLFAASIAWALQGLNQKNRAVLRGSSLGAATALLLLTKWTGLFFFGGLLFSLCKKTSSSKKALLSASIIFLLILLSVEGLIIFLTQSDLQREGLFWLSKNPSSKIWNSASTFVLHKKLPGQMFLFLLALPALLNEIGLHRLRKKTKETAYSPQHRPVTSYFAYALLLGLLWLSLGNYRPFRYFIPLILPLCFLSGASYGLIRSKNQKKWRHCFISMALILGLIHVVHNLEQYWNWAKRPQYTISTFSHMVGEKWKNAIIAGVSPNFALIENEHYGLRWEESGVNSAALAQGEWTHLVIPQDFHYPRTFRRRFPQAMNQVTRLGTVQIVNWPHEVYALNLQRNKFSETSPGRWQATNPDPHTSQGITRLTWKEKPLQIIHVDETILAPKETQAWTSSNKSLLISEGFWLSLRGKSIESENMKETSDLDGVQFGGLTTRKNKKNMYSGSLRTQVTATKENPVFYIFRGRGNSSALKKSQLLTSQKKISLNATITESKRGLFWYSYIIAESGVLTLQLEDKQSVTLLGRLPYTKNSLLKMSTIHPL